MLVQTGAKYLIVLQGNVDILIPDLIGRTTEIVPAEQIIKATARTLIASTPCLWVFRGTLNPVKGYPFPGF